MAADGVATRVRAQPRSTPAPSTPPLPDGEPKVLKLTNKDGPRPITAAAHRISLTTRGGRKLLEASPQRWQDEAWAYFGTLPEVSFAASFLGNAMSRVRWFPAATVAADEPPVPLEDAEGIPDGLAEAAREELDRISNDRDGMAGIKRDFGINLSIAGEAYLVNRPAEADEDDQEPGDLWGVYSSASLKPRGDKVFLQEMPGSKRIELPEDTLVYRIWRRDPQWPGWAWSNMKASLDTCEELLLHSRTLRAIAKSGANAGALLVPTEMDPPLRPRANPDDTSETDPTAPGEGEQMTEMERAFVEWLTTAVEDDGSPTQVAPPILRGAYQFLDRVRHLTFARQIDDKLIERIEHLLDRLAHGMDIPVEILKGLGSANHWSAWQIEDSSWKAHVEPTDQIAAQGVNYSFLRPALLERGFPADQVRKVVIGLDPSALVVRPNRAQDAKDAHDRWALSDEALLSALGFSDGDMPTDEEILRRLAVRRGAGSPKLTAALLEQTGLATDLPEDLGSNGSSSQEDTSGDGTDPVEGGEPTPISSGEGGQPSLTAAVPVSEISGTLASLEPRLQERLTVAASAAVTEAVRKTGSRIRGATQGHPVLAERVNGQPPEDVGRILGPLVVAELADMDRLLDGAFDGLAAQWDAWVGQAQAQVASALTRHVEAAPNPAEAEAALASYQGQADADRDAGWVVLAGLLVAHTRDLIFGLAEEFAEGEGDPSVSVPYGLPREALARAGGQPGLRPAGTIAGIAGLTTGVRVLTLLAGFGLGVDRWRWVTGVPAHPFEPHQRLEGVEFDRPDDPQLANPGTWPPVGFLAPGDHRGCQCFASPLVLPLSAEQAA